MTHEDVLYTPKKLEFSNLHRPKYGEHVWERTFRVWDNGRRHIKLNQAEFIDMGSLSRHSTFNVAAQGVRKGSNNLFCWLSVTWQKVDHSELKMLDLSLFNVEKEIQRLREIRM